MEYQGFLVPRPPLPLTTPAAGGLGVLPILAGVAAVGTAAYFLFFRK